MTRIAGISAAVQERGRNDSREAPINNTKPHECTSEVCSTLVLSAIWPVPSQPAVQGSPGELREKLPGETEMGLRREGAGKTRLLRLRNTLFLKLAIFFDELSGSEL